MTNEKTPDSAASALSAGLDFPTWEEAISGITDSRFVGHQKINELHTNCTRAGARIMYDRLYVLMKSNVEFSGGAPLHGAASAGTQGYASGGGEDEA